jgi:hypothetical protein
VTTPYILGVIEPACPTAARPLGKQRVRITVVPVYGPEIPIHRVVVSGYGPRVSK